MWWFHSTEFCLLGVVECNLCRNVELPVLFWINVLKEVYFLHFDGSTSVLQQGLKPQSLKEERHITDTNEASLRNTCTGYNSALAFEDVFVFRHVGIMMGTCLVWKINCCYNFFLDKTYPQLDCRHILNLYMVFFRTSISGLLLGTFCYVIYA